MISPKLKAELRRLRRNRFYYIGRSVPEYMWRDREGNFRGMHLMDLSHLQACIRLITKDIKILSSSLVSKQAAGKIEPKVRLKREELRAIFKEKSVE